MAGRHASPHDPSRFTRLKRALVETAADYRAELSEARSRGARLRLRAEAAVATLRALAAIVPASSELPHMRHLSQDLRYACRRLLRQPGFTLVAVVMLGLGVGSVATLFSVLNGAVLRPVDLPDARRLVGVARSDEGGTGRTMSYPDFVDVRSAASGVFDSTAVFRNWQGTFAAGGRAETLQGEVVSGDYFRTVGVVPAAGRLLGPDDDRLDGAAVVLSHRIWRTWFGGRDDAVGRVVTISGRPFTIVGVAPESFNGLTVPTLQHSDLWLPLAARVVGRISSTSLEDRSVLGLRLIARLRPDADAARARAMLEVTSERLKALWPDARRQALQLITLREVVMPDGFDVVAGGIGATIVGLALVVLLIACGNIAHLTLAHAFGRAGELAIRASAGASRWRLFRLLIVETSLLVIVAGVAGFLMSSLIAHALTATVLPPMDGVQLTADVRPDLRVYAFTMAVVAITVLATGLLPAWRASRVAPARVIAAAGVGASTPRSRGRTMLVSAQVAVSMTLLLVAVVLLRSVTASFGFDRGFETERQAIMRIDASIHGYDEARGTRLFARLREEASRLPGVEAAALVNRFPTTSYGASSIVTADADTADAARADARTFVVSPEYFDAVRIPVLAGRRFDERDAAGSPRVGIVSAALAARLWPGGDAVGRRLVRRTGADDELVTSIEIVGVTGHIGVYGRTPQALVLWTPASQTYLPSMGVVVRTSESPSVAVERLRGALAAIDPRVAPLEARPLTSHVESLVVLTRMSAMTVAALAAVALTISLVGLYAIVAHHVGTRTREIGLRMAIGASAGDVRWMVQRQTLRLLTYGLVPGVVLAWIAAVGLRGFLFGVVAPDAPTFAAVAGLLVVVGLAATAVPARRAARVDPIRALRST
jgi:predicted permease